MTVTSAATWRPSPAVAQLWSVHTLAARDLRGTLARIADIGFFGVEPISLYGHSAADTRAILDDLGLTMTSAHVDFPVGDAGERVLDCYADLGVQTLVWSMEPAEFASPELVRAGVERVNEAARRAAARGMTIGYHNHFAEFTNSWGGRSAYEHLLDVLDPAVVLEVDLYWATVAGVDAAELVRGRGDRVRLLHVKDGPATGMDDVMTALGEGAVHVDDTVRACSALESCIVELDRTEGDMFDALAQSYDYLLDRSLATGRLPSRTERPSL
ncbi:Sugar phosphate isomerase/epimerase [Sanguibacter gelidistatuariae]|uniref:Sugar phosphate isomerase/epimerase n=1 Tax=Sanguibacter gelidistatuariae TaxID=1814289 RepID=A0A1G6MT55_9MICO|nr:sugar phosphate isomerase/epimerase [Sanguibacter gelidistatuariae]SDC58740.1 Sugar phosphate isomerase/epimerase [Sanguibacter gelidistatuariae]